MPTPGEQLRAAREARKLSITQVVQATRIRSYYVEAMEADDLSMMPSAVQARGFLRSYAEFLGLDFASLSNPAPAVADPEPIPQPEPESEPAPEPVPEPEPEPQPEILPEADEFPLDEAQGMPEQPLETVDLQPSDLIFRQIGFSLGQRRELLGLTLEEIERHTRVRKANLQRIEQGDFDSLASPVQARGMLNTYANFLDLNGEAMLLRFAEGLQARRAERQPEVVRPAARRRWALPLWLRNLFSPDLFFGVVMVVSITLLVLWGATRIIQTQEEALEDDSQAPSISDVLLATPEGVETPTLEAIPTSIEEIGIPLPGLDDEPTAEVEVTEFSPGSLLQVTLILRERVFLRVLVDGEVVREGRFAPGAALTFDARERIEVLVANGGAVQVIYNQFDFGLMGDPGQVVNRIYTFDGIQTPTATVTPTPTETPRFQATATPTITLTPTLTEIP